ncbi:MAG: N-acetyltransferase family protein [Pseudomonadota bacterium]
MDGSDPSADHARPQLAIRGARAEDMPAIHAIYAHAVVQGTGSFELEPPTLTAMVARWRDIAETYPWIVALHGSEIVGYAYAGPYRPRPGYHATLSSSVYVAERAQGQGVGRALLARLLDEAASAGFRQIVATIGDSANLASIRLHESAGFAHIGVLRSVGWKHGRWLDTVIMQRPLGPGETMPMDRG